VRTDYNFGARHRHSYRVYIKDEPPQLVRIKFSPHAARYIDETYHHPSQKKLRGDDGSLILSLTVSEPREVLWYLVFPWGNEAEILEPQWLREEVIKAAQQIVETYQKNTK
jgi:predicted DNA-binding transcriptional regulator YafY